MFVILLLSTSLSFLIVGYFTANAFGAEELHKYMFIKIAVPSFLVIAGIYLFILTLQLVIFLQNILLDYMITHT